MNQTKLVTLPYMAETAEVRSLLSSIQAEDPAKDITALCAEAVKQNGTARKQASKRARASRVSRGILS